MSLLVYTARYSWRDPDRLDITRGGNDRERRRRVHERKADPSKVGLFLAPSEALLWPFKRELTGIEEERVRGKLTDGDAENERTLLFDTYAAAYRLEMRESYTARRPEWDALLARRRVVLVCFCTSWKRCHRALAARFLRACGALNCGELS